MARYGYKNYSYKGWPNTGNQPPVRTYIATSDRPVKVDNLNRSATDHFPASEIEVEMPSEVALDNPRILDENDDYDDTDFRMELYANLENTVSGSEKAKLTEQQFHTPQMFVSRPGKITSAFSHPDMRHSTGKLFGMIFDDLRGHRLIADASLSAHSSKLVQKALEAGLLEENPNNPHGEVTNRFTFQPRLRASPAPTQRPIEDVNRATKDLIDRLNHKSANLSEQFKKEPPYEQPSLF